jgi:cytoskeletal protein CcmA (bactofilin family)
VWAGEQVDHNLTIGVGAAIQAELKAHTIIIGGAVTGNVTATERIEETGFCTRSCPDDACG